MSIRELILAEFLAAGVSRKRAVRRLEDNTALTDTGLDSLGLALLISRLEELTGTDPLSTLTVAEFPGTVGEIVNLYERALA